MAFTESLAPFFNTADFALAATYGPAHTTVNGIFDAPYLEQLSVSGTDPVFVCATADVADAADGYLLTVSGTTYAIRGIQPDGTGVTALQLHRYAAIGYDTGFDAGFGA